MDKVKWLRINFTHTTFLPRPQMAVCRTVASKVLKSLFKSLHLAVFPPESCFLGSSHNAQSPWEHPGGRGEMMDRKRRKEKTCCVLLHAGVPHSNWNLSTNHPYFYRRQENAMLPSAGSFGKALHLVHSLRSCITSSILGLIILRRQNSMGVGFLLIQYTVVANSTLSLRVFTPFFNFRLCFAF